MKASFENYLRHSILSFLRHIVLCVKGEPVEVNRVIVGDRRLPNPVNYRNYDDPFVFRRSSPIVYFVASWCSHIFQYARVFDEGGNPLEIDGFRLRNPAEWVQASRGDPNEILQYVSGKCGIACTFCYLKGNTPELRRLHRSISEAELLYRIKLFQQGKTIFPKNIVSTDEQTTNPHLFRALEEIRQKTTVPVSIETNGVFLTDEMIERLGSIENLLINISVNTIDEELRGRLLHDKHPSRVVSNLEHLAAEHIPFSISIVPWFEVPLDDLERTIEFAHKIQANHIRIRLPGYTSSFSPKKLYDLDDLWGSILHTLRKIRKKVETPIIVEPNKYEQLLLYETWSLPVVLGTVKNSPAYKTGLRLGDYVRKVNGKPVFWRSDGMRELVRFWVNRRDVELEITRQSSKLFRLVEYSSEDQYPYASTDHRSPYGLFLCDDIHTETIRRLKILLFNMKPKRAMVISSVLMKKSVTSLFEMFGLFDDYPEMELYVVPNTYFGGNIFMGDLVVVRDILDYIDSLPMDKERPDLLILPSSGFNEHGRDLLGESYKTIEHATGIPALLLRSRLISL